MKFRLLLLAISCCAFLSAQQDRGSITGVIKDSTGSLIPDAKIIATRIETNTITNSSSSSSGDYTFPSLDIGTYTIRVEK